MTDIKLVIEGEEIKLQQNGKSRRGTYEKWRAPDEYEGQGIGDSPLVVTVYRKPGWTPSKGE